MEQLAAGQFEKLASGLYLEGLAVDYARDVIWYSDVIGGGIHGIRPDGTKVTSFSESRMWTGGVMMNADGAVLSTGEGGIMWNNPDTGQSGWLLSELDGVPINGINEMMPDGTGGIFFGTNDIEMVIKGETARPTATYRLTADRQTIRLADGIGFTNGIMYGPGYGAHKAGVDKMAFDMAIDFKHAQASVAALSIWMGALATDRLLAIIAADPEKYGYLKDQIETPEFTGHIIWALFNDPGLMERSGQTVIGAELAREYGISDEGGLQPPSYRDTHKVWPHQNFPMVIR